MRYTRAGNRGNVPFSVPGAPLEIRWSLNEGDDWAMTASALTSKLCLVRHDANDEWQAKEDGTIGDPAGPPARQEECARRTRPLRPSPTRLNRGLGFARLPSPPPPQVPAGPPPPTPHPPQKPASPCSRPPSPPPPPPPPPPPFLCADQNGCPLAWDAFEKMREEIIARAELHGQVRLVFMSLDPAHDTPGMLTSFARRFEASASIVPWHFLTTYSNLFLKPVLRDMGEEISIGREASSGGGVVINHLPKVFLIDKQGFVREIYSNQSLDPAMILGDIKTLLLEESKASGHKE